MIKRKFIFLLSVLLLLNLIFCADATKDFSATPKNILVGSFIGGNSHLKPMLDVTAVLSERGYNVRTFFFKKKQ
jgi:hypothetical protein